MPDTAPTKTRVPAVEGLFTTDDPPHLIGGLLAGPGGYCFPRDLGGADPAAAAAKGAAARRTMVEGFSPAKLAAHVEGHLRRIAAVLRARAAAKGEL